MSIRKFTDGQGKNWIAERVGRTSGIVGPKGIDSSMPGPADMIRFVCRSDTQEIDRETTMGPGAIEKASEKELAEILGKARKIWKATD